MAYPLTLSKKLIDYELEGKRSKVKVLILLSKFIQDQPLQLGSSNIVYISALLRRGEKSRSLPHCYLFIAF